jgi:hypothetical protein
MRNPDCKACDEKTVDVGFYFYCRTAGCDRFAVPVNEEGQSDEDIREIAARESDRQAYRFHETAQPEDDATGYNATASFEATMREGGSFPDGHARND